VTRLSVSVCIPTIPGREGLLMDRALASVDAQRRRPDRILVEKDLERTGAAATRNRLLERVTTDVIAWLDDDDELLPNHLMACMRILERDSSVDLVYPRPRMVGGTDPTAVTYQGTWRLPWGIRFGPEQEAHLREHGSFIPMTHLVRTATVRQAGGFPYGRTLPTGRYQGEDERYLIALLDAGARFEHLDAKTWRWHVHRDNTAGRGTR
jgi:glycosyltransferase involved in cell wall biosynthesis